MKAKSKSKDSSTSAHLVYYLIYPRIVSESSISQILFGYGYNCSGFIFSVIDNRYNLGNWSVESEIMDRLYSLGIVGFLLYVSVSLYCYIKFCEFLSIKIGNNPIIYYFITLIVGYIIFLFLPSILAVNVFCR